MVRCPLLCGLVGLRGKRSDSLDLPETQGMEEMEKGEVEEQHIFELCGVEEIQTTLCFSLHGRKATDNDCVLNPPPPHTHTHEADIK